MRKTATKNTTPATARAATGPSMSARRVKEMAKRLRPLVAEARGVPSEQESLDWAAKAIGFESYEGFKESLAGEGRTARPLFDIHAGTQTERIKNILGLPSSKTSPWMLSEKAMLGHELVLGSTGSGKTETLAVRCSLLLEANPGMGMLYLDGKGDWALYSKFWLMAHGLGRSSEVRLVNFMGWREASGSASHSNTFNPVEGFDAPMVARWLSICFEERMLALAGASGEPRAAEMSEALCQAVASAYVDRLRCGAGEPGVAGLSKCVGAARMAELASGSEISQETRALIARCDALCEYPAAAREASGPLSGLRTARAAMELCVSDILTSWLRAYPDVLGPVKGTKGGWLRAEVSPFAAFDGEIVIALLPALEKSMEELAALGSAVCASFFVAQEAMESCWPRRMSACAVFDEFGYYMPSAIGVFLEDAKRAGTAVMLGAQDMHAAARTAARSAHGQAKLSGALDGVGIKTFMKMEAFDEPQSTFAFDALQAERLSPSHLDLKGQREGEAWVAGGSARGQVLLAYKPFPRIPGIEVRVERVAPMPLDPWSVG